MPPIFDTIFILSTEELKGDGQKDRQTVLQCKMYTVYELISFPKHVEHNFRSILHLTAQTQDNI